MTRNELEEEIKALEEYKKETKSKNDELTKKINYLIDYIIKLEKMLLINSKKEKFNVE